MPGDQHAVAEDADPTECRRHARWHARRRGQVVTQLFQPARYVHMITMTDAAPSTPSEDHCVGRAVDRRNLPLEVRP
jgi:hypothetical protein